jgi:hypothetical protein
MSGIGTHIHTHYSRHRRHLNSWLFVIHALTTLLVILLRCLQFLFLVSLSLDVLLLACQVVSFQYNHSLLDTINAHHPLANGAFRFPKDGRGWTVRVIFSAVAIHQLPKSQFFPSLFPSNRMKVQVF